MKFDEWLEHVRPQHWRDLLSSAYAAGFEEGKSNADAYKDADANLGRLVRQLPAYTYLGRAYYGEEGWSVADYGYEMEDLTKEPGYQDYFDEAEEALNWLIERNARLDREAPDRVNMLRRALEAPEELLEGPSK